MPPINTLLEEDLTRFSKDQLSKYLRFYSIIPDFTKPAMKAQMRKLISSLHSEGKESSTPIDTRDNSIPDYAHFNVVHKRAIGNSNVCINCETPIIKVCPQIRCSWCCHSAGLLCDVHSATKKESDQVCFPLEDTRNAALVRTWLTSSLALTLFDAQPKFDSNLSSVKDTNMQHNQPELKDLEQKVGYLEQHMQDLLNS